MKKFIFVCAAFLILACNTNKTESTSNISISEAPKTTTFKAPSEFFPKDKVQVLVVGSFHMNYPGLDSHKTNDDNKIDVLKQPKKSEMDSLVAYIKKFKPNKIAVEASPKWNATQKLREYKNGQHRDSRDETYQIAMRIANDLQLDTVYGIDARALSYDLYKKDSVQYYSMIDKLDWDLEDTNSERQYDWYEYSDSIIKTSTLLDYFTYSNSPEYHKQAYGVYLTGWFKDDSNQGADQLSMWWYNRNLRIFRNIVGITENTDDRIMVLMGNGHASLLRHLFDVSVEYDFVEFNSL